MIARVQSHGFKDDGFGFFVGVLINNIQQLDNCSGTAPDDGNLIAIGQDDAGGAAGGFANRLIARLSQYASHQTCYGGFAADAIDMDADFDMTEALFVHSPFICPGAQQDNQDCSQQKDRKHGWVNPFAAGQKRWIATRLA